jgi:hypothetical protein
MTRYLDNPYLQFMADIVDPYCKSLPSLLSNKIKFDTLAYFDRYRNVQLFQIQAADDEFFLPDSEVICSLKYIE